jgi:glycosyltransferase involved in cell wall biosynthesis
MSTLRIAIVAHGRFHAFDLARELIARGHDVTLLTNYPRWAVARFGVPVASVRSFVAHGVLARLAAKLPVAARRVAAERRLHRMFGRWAERVLAERRWDIVHAWSGVSEEILLSKRVIGHTVLMRGSSHIAVQARLLAEEARQAGVAIDRPSPWMIAREMREYAQAERILVLSSFARQTFVDEGTSDERLIVLPLGADVGAFRPGAQVATARTQRILAGGPLRVVCVGTVSYQKGLAALAKVVEQVDNERVEISVVGPALPESEPVLRRLRSRPGVRIVGYVPQHQLPAVYAQADVFLFPTVQDGYGMVLAQAQAAGLPVLASTHSAAPDCLRHGDNGWLVEPGDVQGMIDVLNWCDRERSSLATMAARVYRDGWPRSWATVAADFEAVSAALGDASAGAHA